MNGPESSYNKQGGSFGDPTTYYIAKEDKRHMLDFLDPDHKPYLVAVTVLVESPMKLYVLNQNHSQVLFGS